MRILVALTVLALGVSPLSATQADEESAHVRAFLADWWTAHGDTPVLVKALIELAKGRPLPIASRSEQGTLIRLTREGEGLCRDVGSRAPGRGGYLHDRRACWDTFVARRGPVRSFRASVSRPVRETLVRELEATGSRREGY